MFGMFLTLPQVIQQIFVRNKVNPEPLRPGFVKHLISYSGRFTCIILYSLMGKYINKYNKSSNPIK